jgi:hypothetical protein
MPYTVYPLYGCFEEKKVWVMLFYLENHGPPCLDYNLLMIVRIFR